jgi:hypothetical protein
MIQTLQDRPPGMKFSKRAYFENERNMTTHQVVYYKGCECMVVWIERDNGTHANIEVGGFWEIDRSIVFKFKKTGESRDLTYSSFEDLINVFNHVSVEYTDKTK